LVSFIYLSILFGINSNEVFKCREERVPCILIIITMLLHDKVTEHFAWIIEY